MVNGLGSVIRAGGSLLPSALVRPFGRPVALFFHGVEKRITDARIQSNSHELAHFANIVRTLSRNFDVLPLSELPSAIRRPSRHRRSVFLMSDDGYANLIDAADLLDEHSLPWTLFVSTHHIDTAERNPVFLARVFYLFAPSGRYKIPNFEAPIELPAIGDREEVAAAGIARLKASNPVLARDSIAAMISVFPPAELSTLLSRFKSDAFLTWKEVSTLKRRGVEIGAHANLHWPMHAGQNAAYLEEQARTSRARIESEIGPCRYFAYPFGNVADIGPLAWRAVRDAGFDYGFTTLSGTLDASLNPFLMPRYGLQMREDRLTSLLPVLRSGNARLIAWQKKMAA